MTRAEKIHATTTMKTLEMAVLCARAVLLLVANGLLVACSFLPIAVQSRNAVARLGLPSDEIAAVVRKVSAAYQLDAQWIRKASAVCALPHGKSYPRGNATKARSIKWNVPANMLEGPGCA